MMLVSHSAILIETLSDECLFMRRGQGVMLGPPREVLKAYEQDGVQQASVKNTAKALALVERNLDAGYLVGIRAVTLRAAGGEPGYWLCGRDAELLLDLHSVGSLEEVSINLMIIDLTHQQNETVQFMMSSRDIGWLRLKSGDVNVCLALPRLGLRPGTYRLKLSISRSGMHDILDVVDDVRLIVRDAAGMANCLYFQ